MTGRFFVLLARLGVVLGVALAMTPALAHHSTAMYDSQRPVTVTGTVKRFDWANPHAFVYLEVKDEMGNVVEWEVEMMSLNHLRAYVYAEKPDYEDSKSVSQNAERNDQGDKHKTPPRRLQE